jgi:homocitrate synthase NifV
MILDSTLREGLQRYGLQLGLEDRWRLLAGLARAGIPEAEIGVCGRDPAVEILAQRSRAAGLPIRISVWCPLRIASLEHAARIRPDSVNLSIPTSEAHVRERLHLDPKGLERMVAEFVAMAAAQGLDHLSLGFEDASRTDPATLERLAGLAQELGVRRLRLADTVGILDPAATASLVRRLRKSCRLEIGFHGHNDFGMATANALSALDAGATWVDATLLGVGERSGIAATEELASFLHFRRGRGFDPGRVAELAREFIRVGALRVAPWKPIVGEALFHAESGMHVQGMLINPALYEPFDPSGVGAVRKLSLGRQSGRAAVRQHFSALGTPLRLEDEGAVVTRIQAEAQRLGRPLEPGEIPGLDHPAAS